VKRVFGPPSAPVQTVSPERKFARLGNDGRAKMLQAVAARGGGFFLGTRNRAHASVMGQFSDRLREVLSLAFQDALARLDEQEQLLDQELQGLLDLLTPVQALRCAARPTRPKPQSASCPITTGTWICSC
jgi:hypothetical protein